MTNQDLQLILEWLSQHGFPGLCVIGTIVGIVYCVRCWIKNPRPVSNLPNQLLLEHNELINKLTSTVAALPSAEQLSQFTNKLDDLLDKELHTRMHNMEGCASHLSYRVSKLEENAGMKQGPKNYDGYIKGRESGNK